MQQGNRLSWSDLQSLARRKPATSSTDRAPADDGANGRRLAKTLSVPHLTGIGTFAFPILSQELRQLGSLLHQLFAFLFFYLIPEDHTPRHTH